MKGGPLATMYAATILSRRVELDARSCWLWLGTLSSDGYGLITFGSTSEHRYYVHRVMYQIFIGPIGPYLSSTICAPCAVAVIPRTWRR